MSMNVAATNQRTFYEVDEKGLKKSRLEERGRKKTSKDDAVKSSAKSDISEKNEAKLSQKAQDFLMSLREKYGDYDFMIGNSTDDLKSLAKSGTKEFSVIFSSAELERMANDEKYANEKMQGVEGAVKMSKRICEENGFVSAFGNKDGEQGVINRISITVNDDGTMKIFAELEKTSVRQKERIEKSKEKRAEEEKQNDKTQKQNPYEKDKQSLVKKTTIEADSMDEFLEKLNHIQWDEIESREARSGERFDFSI